MRGEEKEEIEFICPWCSTVGKDYKFKKMIGTISGVKDHAVCPQCGNMIKQK